MIGNEPRNAERMRRLQKLREVGYRGVVSVTAYYACDIYDINDLEITYKGRYRFGDIGFMYPNFRQVYKKYGTHPCILDEKPFTFDGFTA